jgi:cephalosporin-C deacetylase-like acetyl esterase
LPAPPLDSRTQVSGYLERAARAITDRAAAEIRSCETWDPVRARRLEELRDMLGLLPWPKRTPLNIRIAGRLDRGEYTIEKIAFESLPKIYVTANLYLPKQHGGRVPGIIYVCGHAPTPYGAKTEYQQHGISFAKNGYAAFLLDPIQLAETFGLHHGPSSQKMDDWYSRGYTPAGIETWNAMRAIDYLETRPEIDSSRLGITGRSGGAAMSWFTGAVDSRLKVVSPVMGISTYAEDVRQNTQRLHCDCMFPINALMHDMTHQGALIAPRPLLMMHGRKDNMFPVAGYTEFQETVSALYASYGRAGDFGNIVVDTGHLDSDYLRERAIRWFDRYLLNAPDRQLDMTYTRLPGAELAVYPQGPPADAGNFRVHETFTTRPPSQPYPTLAAWESRRQSLLQTLRRNVFTALPSSVHGLNVERFATGPGMPDRYTELRLSSDHTVPVRGLVRHPAKPSGPAPALLYIASDGETPTTIHDFLYGINERDRAVRMIVFPRGVSDVPWDRGVWRDMERNAMFVGQTVDSMRLADVLVAVEALRREEGVDPSRILVAGDGVSGALGLYAAILDPGIAQVMLVNAPVTHVDRPIFLNVLRHTDLPEAAALIAPRHLTFYSRMPAAYEYTRHVYHLYGKPANLCRAMDIQGVAEGRYDHNFASGN